MKTIIIFYDNETKYTTQKVFNDKTSKFYFDEWKKSLGYDSFEVKAETGADLLKNMAQIATEQNANTVVFAWNDCPFLNIKLSKEILENHVEYKSEYTFADGFPYGFAPEVIDAGTLRILAEIAATTQETEGKKSVNRETIFNLIKTDINSFDIESVLADEDWRLLRYGFHCGTKDNFMQCKALFEACNGKTDDANNLSKIASTTLGCLKTVPGFYNLQITGYTGQKSIYSPLKDSKTSRMTFEDFSNIVDQIAAFSENAVVSLSAFCEPFEHPDLVKMVQKILSYKGLSVFIETDGLLVTPELAEELKQVAENTAENTAETALENVGSGSRAWDKIMIVVKVDAASAQVYKKIHPESEQADFEKVLKNLSVLCSALPDSVYPQLTRMKENEDELETFYRFWSDKNSLTGGKVIIQKYNSYCGVLPERKVADLSPLERNVCWHLRRDLTILADGSVTLCSQQILSAEKTNILKDGIEKVWKERDEIIKEQIENKYNGKCKDCDEYYTYNF